MKNLPSILYALAAVIWLALGVMGWNVIYIALAVVFFVLAGKGLKRKKE